jgi:hypothetical protein
MSQFTNEKEFDEKLAEIGDCYEAIKDSLNSMYAPSNRLDFERAFENLVTLRNIAAMQLKENYTLKEN